MPILGIVASNKARVTSITQIDNLLVVAGGGGGGSVGVGGAGGGGAGGYRTSTNMGDTIGT